STVSSGPAINTTYPLGYFREDYGWISHPNNDEYLDEHNGRFCVTPEYPNGTYAYFCTVDGDWNSTYPYAVGPTFYGVYTQGKVASISETTTVYTSSIGISEADFRDLNISIFPNPASDLIAIQIQELVKDDLQVNLLDLSGRLVQRATINKGSTIAYFDVQTVYEGTYIIQILNKSSGNSLREKIVIKRD
nr:YHYH protein [Bacteroidota bacterium]